MWCCWNPDPWPSHVSVVHMTRIWTYFLPLKGWDWKSKQLQTPKFFGFFSTTCPLCENLQSMRCNITLLRIMHTSFLFSFFRMFKVAQNVWHLRVFKCFFSDYFIYSIHMIHVLSPSCVLRTWIEYRALFSDNLGISCLLSFLTWVFKRAPGKAESCKTASIWRSRSVLERAAEQSSITSEPQGWVISLRLHRLPVFHRLFGPRSRMSHEGLV